MQSEVKNAVTAVIGDPQTGGWEEPARNCVINVCDERWTQQLCQPLDRQTL